MKKLKVDLDELIIAFQSGSWEMNHYLDLETGGVILISDEDRMAYESFWGEADDAGKGLAQLVAQSDLPEWQQERVLEVDRIEAGYGERFIEVPEDDSHEGYRDMEAFIATLEDKSLQDQLWRAIGGRGAFRRFKELLHEDRRQRERWFAFEGERVQERVVDWLRGNGIEPVIKDPPAEALGPPIRAHLIAGALTFARAARELPGVLRIALIGSLATDEPDPKDADLLVRVRDDMELAPLARLGRKLQGHCQSINRGGEVFLADPAGRYLGRTCPWKQCGPGIRASCDALHCGRRSYLHDDLGAVRLQPELIAAPPVELWPRVLSRVEPPRDLDEGLLEPLGEEV